MLFALPMAGCDWDEKTEKYIEKACTAIATWHANSRTNCLLIEDQALRAQCLLQLNQDYTKLTAAKVAALLAEESCNETAFKAAMETLEELLKGLTKLVGANVMTRLDDSETALVSAQANFNGQHYQLMPGAFAEVDMGTSIHPVFLSGSFGAELLPDGPGFAGPVTSFEVVADVQGPGELGPVVLTLVTGPDTFESTVTMQPDAELGGFSGVMHVVLQAQVELLGDPVVVMTIPVHSFAPPAQLSLTTNGQFVPGTQIFPTIASTADPDADCNGNGIADVDEIASGAVEDCNANGIPDSCDIESEAATDCDGDGVPDACQIAHLEACDTNGNGILDPQCESIDCNNDGIEDCEQMFDLDQDFDGTIDECEGCPAATIIASDPADGVIDARQPFGLGGDPLQGIQVVNVTLSDSGTPNAACWSLCETDSGEYEPNGIESVVGADDVYSITFARPITPNAVTSLWYLGDETGERVSLTSHPANVNTDGVASVADVLALIDALNGQIDLPETSTDIDRSGASTGADVLREIDLLNGVGPWDQQLLTELPEAGTCAVGGECSVTCPDGSVGSISCDQGEAAICWCGSGGSPQAMAKCE